MAREARFTATKSLLFLINSQGQDTREEIPSRNMFDRLAINSLLRSWIPAFYANKDSEGMANWSNMLYVEVTLIPQSEHFELKGGNPANKNYGQEDTVNAGTAWCAVGFRTRPWKWNYNVGPCQLSTILFVMHDSVHYSFSCHQNALHSFFFL